MFFAMARWLIGIQHQIYKSITLIKQFLRDIINSSSSIERIFNRVFVTS